MGEHFPDMIHEISMVFLYQIVKKREVLAHREGNTQKYELFKFNLINLDIFMLQIKKN